MGAIALVLGLSFYAPATKAESALESVGRAGFDLVVLRPLGLGQTAVSVGVLPLGLPVSVLTGTTEDLVEICWTHPIERTFLRPIGDL